MIAIDTTHLRNEKPAQNVSDDYKTALKDSFFFFKHGFLVPRAICHLPISKTGILCHSSVKKM